MPTGDRHHSRRNVHINCLFATGGSSRREGCSGEKTSTTSGCREANPRPGRPSGVGDGKIHRRLRVLRCFGIVGVLVMQPVMLFLTALIIWLIGRFCFHGDFSYMKGVEMVGLASMIAVPGSIIRTLLTVIYGNMSMTAGPVLLVSHFDATNRVHVLLSALGRCVAVVGSGPGDWAFPSQRREFPEVGHLGLRHLGLVSGGAGFTFRRENKWPIPNPRNARKSSFFP